MQDMLPSFWDELRKVAAFSSAVGGAPVPTRSGEMKPPISPPQINPGKVKSRSRVSASTSYSRSNTEAPGTDVTINAVEKGMTPPTVRY